MQTFWGSVLGSTIISFVINLEKSMCNPGCLYVDGIKVAGVHLEEDSESMNAWPRK